MTTVRRPSDINNPKRLFAVILLFCAGFYLLLCTAGCALQRRLIYFPSRLDLSSAEQAGEREGFVSWRNQAGQIVGWRMPAKHAPTASVLVVHGNAGCALNRGYFARPIHEAADVDVYVLEYPGYGCREGSPSLKTFMAAGEEAFDLLPDKLPRYVVSESLGTGVAAHLAKSHSNSVAGFVMFAPYNDFLSLAKERMRFLPVSLILLDRYDPAQCLTEYRGPIKFVVAENDEIIPAKSGRQLHDNYRGRKVLEVIEGAHHNDVSAQSSGWWKDVFQFWQTNSEAAN